MGGGLAVVGGAAIGLGTLVAMLVLLRAGQIPALPFVGRAGTALAIAVAEEVCIRGIRFVVVEFAFALACGGVVQAFISQGVGLRHQAPPPPRGCITKEEASKVAPEAVRQEVGGGCQSGWGRLLLVTNAIEAGTGRPGDSGWA